MLLLLLRVMVVWSPGGTAIFGGNSSSVASSLSSGVTEIFSTDRAFAAIKSDGRVVTWGQSNYGGDSSSVASSLSSGVTEIFSMIGLLLHLRVTVLWSLGGKARGEEIVLQPLV